MIRSLSILLLLCAAACGPIPLAQAEEQCLERARLAQQPRGKISVGVNSDGSTFVDGEVGISTDFLTGADPSQVYDQCVLQKAGQMPSRPFYSLPGAAG